MGGGPIDAPATIAHRKSLLARIDKWRHALPYCFRTYLSELKVASRASGQSTTAWVDRKPLEHFAKLSAKIIRAEVDYIGCCAEPLVAGEHYALLAPSRAQKLGTAKFCLEATSAPQSLSHLATRASIRSAAKRGNGGFSFNFPQIISRAELAERSQHGHSFRSG